MGKKKRAGKAGKSPNFEQSIERLEEIVQQLEGGSLGLNESLTQYEEGVKLLRQSYDALRHAERRIELLSGLDAEGNPLTRPFDDTATLAAEKNSTGQGPSASANNPSAGVANPQHDDNDMDSQEGLF
jgi:exodeoxyribonuclease VII small subunit